MCIEYMGGNAQRTIQSKAMMQNMGTMIASANQDLITIAQ
jgi:hypothetical protein